MVTGSQEYIFSGRGRFQVWRFSSNVSNTKQVAKAYIHISVHDENATEPEPWTYIQYYGVWGRCRKLPLRMGPIDRCPSHGAATQQLTPERHEGLVNHFRIMRDISLLKNNESIYQSAHDSYQKTRIDYLRFDRRGSCVPVSKSRATSALTRS